MNYNPIVNVEKAIFYQYYKNLGFSNKHTQNAYNRWKDTLIGNLEGKSENESPYGLDGEKLYDKETGEIVCENIGDATPEQFRKFIGGDKHGR